MAPLAAFRHMGASRRRDARDWPPPAHQRRFYLESRGHANTLSGDGRLDVRAPADGARPARSRAHRRRRGLLQSQGFPWGPKDQRAAEQRRDVLVYTTPPLRKDVEVIGPVRVVLFAATSARAKPDGRYPAAALSQIAGEAGTGAAGRNLQTEHRRGRDRKRVSEGPSHPHGNLQQQFPALRSQSEYGRTGGRCHGASKIDFGARGAVFCRYSRRRRGSQVVRPGSAKPLFVGSIPTRASSN